MSRPAGASALVLVLLAFTGCDRAKPRDVLLVSLDTFRADRMEAYGGAPGLTPNLDALASGSVVFLDATAPTPITLPSHASLLTGRYPTATGVRNNGTFVLPEEETTLAEVLRAQGWATAAVIAAFPLHARYGLGQGFDRYDDELPEARPETGKALPIYFSERRASEVADRALTQWERMAGSPRFLWAHFFDTHAPYDAPEPAGRRRPDHPYDAEAAYLDEEFGRLLRGVRASSPDAIVIVVADHGESLGEHGEKTHGVFVYQSTIRVPFVLSAPGLLPSGAVAEEPVSLVDLVPTLLDLLGLPPLEKVDGASLLPLVRGGPAPTRPVYAESYLPRLQFRFSELTMLRRGPLKYIDAPTPELYDLASDPSEIRDLSAGHPDLVDLAERLAAFTSSADEDASARAVGTLDPEAEARLRSLGYTSAGTLRTVPGEGRGRDPKTMVDYLRDYDRAVGLVASGKFDEGTEILRSLAARAPENFMVRYQLAAARLVAGRLAESAEDARAVTEVAPEFWGGHLLLAEIEAQRGEIDGAIRAYGAAAETAPQLAEPRFALGRLLESVGRFDAAGDAYLEALSLEPDDREIARRLVELRAGRGELGRAIGDLRGLTAVHPRAVGLRAVLADAHRRAGNRERAESEAAEVLRLSPEDPDALLIAAELRLEKGATGDARPLFERALAREPGRLDALLGLAAIDFADGRPLDAEARLAEILRIQPRYAGVYRVRGEHLERSGDRDGAVRAYRQALAVQPDDRRAREGLRRLLGR